MRLFWSPVPKTFATAVHDCRWHFRMAAVFSALINVLYLAPTIYMMQVYDRVVPTGGVFTLLWLTVAVGVAIATLTSLDAIRSHTLMRASLRFNRLMVREILDRLMSSGASKNVPTTSQAMRDFDTLRQALGGPAAAAQFDLPWTPLYVVVAFVIHPLLGLLLIAGGALLAVLAIANARRTKAASLEASASNARAYAAQQIAIEHSEVIRALGMRESIVNRQISERRAGLEASANVQFAGSQYNSAVKFCRMFMQSLALGLGAYLAIRGQISVGAIIAASVLLSRGLQPVEQLVAAWPTIVQAKQALQMLDRLLDDDAGGTATHTTLPAPEGRLELDRVVVRSPDKTALLLKNVSLGLSPGEILGVIGPSGAGKTTLARVAAGAIPADLGEVRIDDARVTGWDPELLARSIGYVPQDNALLPGSVSENISRFALARGVAAAEIDLEVVRAAKATGGHELILRLPHGYDTQVASTGHGLSTGEAQRIALARAFYGAPRILILDEPNSALDADGEAALEQAIMGARQSGAAVMIIAHRASILRNADRLAVLQDGAVVRVGPYQEIMDALRAEAARPNVVSMKERARP